MSRVTSLSVNKFGFKDVLTLVIHKLLTVFVYIQVEATDADDAEGSELIVYSIYHVSNEGLTKFRIDRTSGVVQVVEKVIAGLQYSITVQATDPGGR